MLSPALQAFRQKPNYDSLFANVNGGSPSFTSSSGNGKDARWVLIHGFGDDARMWLPSIRGLWQALHNNCS